MRKIYELNINKSQKLLLYVLKELGAYDEAIPVTLDELTKISSMNRLTVNNNLKELHQNNFIIVESGKGQASNSYRLNL
ncbi:hypothetical protein ACIQY5_19155 [Peribacillus frigoritolerans]|uniref:hypothetical protein n=1 Tax=Peribacillus frigoritolerans TaxID=450367 RepID=UPI0038072689